MEQPQCVSCGELPDEGPNSVYNSSQRQRNTIPFQIKVHPFSEEYTGSINRHSPDTGVPMGFKTMEVEDVPESRVDDFYDKAMQSVDVEASEWGEHGAGCK